MGKIVVVDYRKGNLSSVARGIQAAGGEVVVSDQPRDIATATGLVLPGVGSFSDAMAFMEASGQANALREALERGVAFLGICLGMQLLFERGFEGGDTRGLGVIPGEVVRMNPSGLKVPHVGWNSIEIREDAVFCPLLEGVASGSHLYFTHSYEVRPSHDEVVAAFADYGGAVPAVTWPGGAVFGCQFHPEKSSRVGLRMLRNFVEISGAAAPVEEAAASAQEPAAEKRAAAPAREAVMELAETAGLPAAAGAEGGEAR